MFKKAAFSIRSAFKAFASWVQNNPIESVLFVKSFALLMYAFYYILPLSIGTPGVLNTAFETPTAHLFIGLTLIAPALYAVVAVMQKNLAHMHAGAFAVMMAWGFLLMLRLFIFGPASASGWILLLAPAATTLVCYLNLGKMLAKS